MERWYENDDWNERTTKILQQDRFEIQFLVALNICGDEFSTTKLCVDRREGVVLVENIKGGGESVLVRATCWATYVFSAGLFCTVIKAAGMAVRALRVFQAPAPWERQPDRPLESSLCLHPGCTRSWNVCSFSSCHVLRGLQRDNCCLVQLVQL